jgi:hypothetical protein
MICLIENTLTRQRNSQPDILSRLLDGTAVFGMDGSIWRRRRSFPHTAGYQSWFCQFLGVAPLALAHYANQLCPCNQPHELDADHLHTCLMHAGNWWSAHELVLSAIAEIAHATGYSTNSCKRVPNSRGQKRGDLEIKHLNVAGTSDIIIDVAVVHEFHGSVAQPD